MEHLLHRSFWSHAALVAARNTEAGDGYDGSSVLLRNLRWTEVTVALLEYKDVEIIIVESDFK